MRVHLSHPANGEFSRPIDPQTCKTLGRVGEWGKLRLVKQRPSMSTVDCDLSRSCKRAQNSRLTFRCPEATSIGAVPL